MDINFLKTHGWRILALISIIALILICYNLYHQSVGELSTHFIATIIIALFTLLIGIFTNKPKFSNERTEEYLKIENYRKLFSENYPNLEPLMDSIIKERIKEIKDAAKGNLKFITESQRESFTTKLFHHLDKIPGLVKIQSLTWDYDDFYSDQWISTIKTTEFIERNLKAKAKHVQIDRIFIFKREKLNEEKKRTFNTLKNLTQEYENTNIKLLFEHELPLYLLEKEFSPSSFLLFLDQDGNVKIRTENCKSKNTHNNLEVRFYNDEEKTELIEQRKRFDNLWKIQSESDSFV